MNQWPHNRRQWRPDSFADCFATFAYGICFWFLIFLLRNSEFWCGRSFTVISVSCSFLPHPPLASPRISLLYFLGTFGFNTEGLRHRLLLLLNQEASRGEEERSPCDTWAQGCQNQQMPDGPAETTLTTHMSFKRPKWRVSPVTGCFIYVST